MINYLLFLHLTFLTSWFLLVITCFPFPLITIKQTPLMYLKRLTSCFLYFVSMYSSFHSHLHKTNSIYPSKATYLTFFYSFHAFFLFFQLYCRCFVRPFDCLINTWSAPCSSPPLAKCLQGQDVTNSPLTLHEPKKESFWHRRLLRVTCGGGRDGFGRAGS